MSQPSTEGPNRRQRTAAGEPPTPDTAEHRRLAQSQGADAPMAAGLQVEFPHGSGSYAGLAAIADAIDDRLIGLFRLGPEGRRIGDPRDIPTGPLWQAHPTFSEYFHGDTGAGLGASHQTGWTALVARLICRGDPPGLRGESGSPGPTGV